MLKKLTLLAAGFASAFAMNNVELNVNSKDLEMGVTLDMGQFNDSIEPDTVFIGGKFLSADVKNSDYTSSSQMDDYMELNFLMKREMDNSGLTIGLGAKLNGTKDFMSVPLGGEVSYKLPLDLSMPFYVGGAVYFAPSVLTMSDADSFMETRITLDVEIIENALVTLGYRNIDTNYEKPTARDINYNSSVYAGVRFKF